jgi:hypothetical protein
MKVTLTPMFEEARGKLGNVVFREVRGKTIASREPRFAAPPSESQAAHRERFKQAVAYGKSALADPEMREMYQAIADSRNVPIFAVTVADFFNAPVIDDVTLASYHGQAGDVIHIVARDDFDLASVHVSISEEGGNAIESGNAELVTGGWEYTATQNVPPGTTVNILVVATDRPGGTSVTTLSKTV